MTPFTFIDKPNILGKRPVWMAQVTPAAPDYSDPFHYGLSPAATTSPGPAGAPPSEGPSLLPLAIPGLIVAASIGASAYHGYKRNKSTGWAVWWGFMGLMLPVITPVVAIAQGYGKREK